MCYKTFDKSYIIHTFRVQKRLQKLFVFAAFKTIKSTVLQMFAGLLVAVPIAAAVPIAIPIAPSVISLSFFPFRVLGMIFVFKIS